MIVNMNKNMHWILREKYNKLVPMCGFGIEFAQLFWCQYFPFSGDGIPIF